MSLKHAKNEVRFERVFIKITKIFAKIIREAPGFFGGPSSLDHEGFILMKIFCKSGSGSQPCGKVPGRKKPERAQVHKKSKMCSKKRVLQLQKMAKNACFACVARVARVACVQCDFQRIKATVFCDFCGFCVFSVVFSCFAIMLN